MKKQVVYCQDGNVSFRVFLENTIEKNQILLIKNGSDETKAYLVIDDDYACATVVPINISNLINKGSLDVICSWNETAQWLSSSNRGEGDV